MHEAKQYTIQGERRISGPETDPVKPDFKIGSVEYYSTSLPNEPVEKPRHTLLPLSDVHVLEFVEDYYKAWNEEHPDPKQQKSIKWKADEHEIKDPSYGSVKQVVTVEYDEEGNLTRVIDDTYLIEDGPIDERTGIATGGSIIVPIEKREDGYYVHCMYQFRPAPWEDTAEVPQKLTDPKSVQDDIALNRGLWMLTVPGGYANHVNEGFENSADREALEETGFKINKPVFTGYYFNRARTATKIGVGFSTFEKVGDAISDPAEITKGKMAVRIDIFDTPDAMVMAGVNYARWKLGLISSGSAQ